MEDRVIKLEEKIAILQDELSQMGHEVYAQQKEMARLLIEIEKLKSRFEHVKLDSGILNPSEESHRPIIKADFHYLNELSLFHTAAQMVHLSNLLTSFLPTIYAMRK